MTIDLIGFLMGDKHSMSQEAFLARDSRIVFRDTSAGLQLGFESGPNYRGRCSTCGAEVVGADQIFASEEVEHLLATRCGGTLRYVGREIHWTEPDARYGMSAGTRTIYRF